MDLNFGSGRDYKKGWVNVDLNPEVFPDVVADLSRLLPFCPDTFRRVEVSHVLEHMPEPIKVLEQLWQVCQDGATVHVRSPHHRSRWAWGDPDHKCVIGPDTAIFISWPVMDGYWKHGNPITPTRPVCDYDLLDARVNPSDNEMEFENEMLLKVVKPIRDGWWKDERRRIRKERLTRGGAVGSASGS